MSEQQRHGHRVRAHVRLHRSQLAGSASMATTGARLAVNCSSTLMILNLEELAGDDPVSTWITTCSRGLPDGRWWI